MSGSGTFCSDCAWPYECARENGCRRRDQGKIRARQYRERPFKQIEFSMRGATAPSVDEAINEMPASAFDAVRQSAEAMSRGKA